MGVMFMTIADETGIANVVVWPSLFARQRRIVLGFGMLAITGKIPREGGVVYLVAQRMFDLTSDLAGLGERGIFRVPTGRQAAGQLHTRSAHRHSESEEPEFSVSLVGGYRGDAVKSTAIGTLSADAVNTYNDASLIRRIFRARSWSHSYAMLTPPGDNEAFRGI